MLLPIGDEPNPREPVVVNWLLIGVNVAVFVLITWPMSNTPAPASRALFEYLDLVARQTGFSPQDILRHGVSSYDLFVFEHGFRAAHPQLIDLLASLFLHAGLAHLLGNMLFLWIFGDNVEHRLGPAGYLAAYLATGVVATVAHGLVAPGGELPLIGASGAISGVLGFYFVWFPQNRVKLLFWLYFWVEVILVPARWVLAFYLVVENLLPFMMSTGTDGVARGAHIGGFIAGMLLAMHLDGRRDHHSIRGWMPPGPRRQPAPDPVPEGSPVRASHIEEVLQAGDPAEAARTFFELDPGDQGLIPAPVVYQLGEWFASEGRPDVALALLRRALRTRPPSADPAPLHYLTGRILFTRMQSPAEAYRHLLAASRLARDPEVKARAEAALAQIHERSADGRPRRWIG